MITEVTITHPEPTINIGGSYSPYSADIVFSVDIDGGEFHYEKCDIKGVTKNKWTLEDIAFMKEVFKKIDEVQGKTLREYVLKNEVISGRVTAAK